MHGKSKAATPEEYIESLEEPRKSDIAALDKLIRETVPQLEPHISYGMLAYGPYHYKYTSGREGDWFRIGLASNKQYISLYCCGMNDHGYVAEGYKERLPKASIGKSCVRFKRVSDLSEEDLKELLKETAASGFGQ